MEDYDIINDSALEEWGIEAKLINGNQEIAVVGIEDSELIDDGYGGSNSFSRYKTFSVKSSSIPFPLNKDCRLEIRGIRYVVRYPDPDEGGMTRIYLGEVGSGQSPANRRRQDQD